MADFIETPRFPDDISYGSSGGPSFKTWVFEGHSGKEQRGIGWATSKARYDVSHAVKNKTDMDTLRAWFYAMNGRAYGFRFKDWGDYELTDENIGTGDGVTATFKIKKTYTVGVNSYIRRIFKPIAAGFVVKVNGVTQTLTTHYTLDATTGKVTFTGGNKPGSGLAVTVTGEFDVPVRFDTDAFAAAHEGFLMESWASIGLVELILEDV